MKKNRILALLLLLSLVLTGCGCRHEWTEADCLNPRLCAKCQQTEGEALGHNWSPATCTQAETCLRCGAVQGQPLEHRYSSWSFTDTHMTHSCETCGLEQTLELDRAIHLQALLSGCWEGFLYFHEESAYSAYDLSTPLDMILFSQDNTASGHINTADFAGTWAFLEYIEEDDQKNYRFSLDTGEEFQWQLVLSRRAQRDILYLFYPNGDQMLLQNNQAIAEHLTASSWGATGSTGMYHLTFHPDRTVTGNLGQDFTGTWQLMPTRETYGILNSGVYICYGSGEEEQILKASILPENPYSNQQTAQELIPATITLVMDKAKCEFTPMSVQQIAQQGELLTQGSNVIVGEWSSLFWRQFRDGYNIDTHLPGYSITFHTDNTFTGFVGREITGVWQYSVDSFGNDSVSTHSYRVQLDGERYVHRVEISCTANQMPELRFWGSTSGSDVKLLNLGKLTPEDQDAQTMPLGTWTSTHEEESSQSGSRVATSEYSVTLLEDGTYTGFIGEDIQGNWVLVRIFYGDDGKPYAYHYDLRSPGAASADSLVITVHEGQVNHVEYRVSDVGYSRRIYLEQYTQQELEAIQSGPSLPVGEWTSHSVTWGSTQQQVQTAEYTLSLREDGTFTAQLDTALQGTWYFDHYDPGNGWYYRFAFPGQSQDHGYQYLYLSQSQEYLTFSIVSDEKDDFYYMER